LCLGGRNVIIQVGGSTQRCRMVERRLQEMAVMLPEFRTTHFGAETLRNHIVVYRFGVGGMGGGPHDYIVLVDPSSFE
jgi:hypothetical protein